MYYDPKRSKGEEAQRRPHLPRQTPLHVLYAMIKNHELYRQSATAAA